MTVLAIFLGSIFGYTLIGLGMSFLAKFNPWKRLYTKTKHGVYVLPNEMEM